MRKLKILNTCMKCLVLAWSDSFLHTLWLWLSYWAKALRWMSVLTRQAELIPAAPASSWQMAHPLHCLTPTGHGSSLGSWRSSGRSTGSASVAHDTFRRSRQTWCAQHRTWSTCLYGGKALVHGVMKASREQQVEKQVAQQLRFENMQPERERRAQHT